MKYLSSSLNIILFQQIKEYILSFLFDCIALLVRRNELEMFGSKSSSSGNSSLFESSFAIPNASGTATDVVQTTSSLFQTFVSQSAPAFGSSASGSGFSSTPAFGIPSSASGHSSAFGSSFAILNASGTATGVAGTTSSLFQTFGSQPALAFGSSASGFGFSSTLAFGISSSGSSALGQKPAFAASNTTGVGFSFPPNVGQSTTLFGKSDLLGSTKSSLGTQSSFSGSLFSKPPFGSLTKGSRVATYTTTADVESRKLVSISAMPIYKDKSHEELRCEDYQSGDKGGFVPGNSNPKPNALFSVPASLTPFTSTSNIFPVSNVSSCATCPPFTCSFNSLAPKNPFSIKSPFTNSSSPFGPTSSSSSIQPSYLPVSAVNPFSFPTTSMHIPTNSAFPFSSAPSFTNSLTTSSFPQSQSVTPPSSRFGPTCSSSSIQPSSLSSLPVNPSPFSTPSNHFPLQSLSFTINIFQPSPFANFPSTTSSYTPAIVTVSAPSSCVSFPSSSTSISASEFSPGFNFTFNQPTSLSHSSAPSLHNSVRGVTVTEAGGENRSGNVGTYSEKPKMEHTDDSTKERNSQPKEVHDVEVFLPRLQISCSYYTEPRIQELAAKERAEPGFCSHVNNFVVGRHGYGSIKFMGETDVRSLDIESIFVFNHGEVIVYKDESKKPGVGEGLNKPAEVTLLNIKCFDEKTGQQYMDGPRVQKYREMLKKSAEEQGAEFVSYDPVGGEWKFRVQHF